MEENAAIEKTTAQESNTPRRRSFMRRLHYWWSLFVAGALLGLLGPPILLFSWLVNKQELVASERRSCRSSRSRITGSETDVCFCFQSPILSRHGRDVYLHRKTNRV